VNDVTNPGAAGIETPRQWRLLCVDDEPNILSSLRRLFRGAGYQIAVANSGAEGLQALEAEGFDLVISDMRMPEMDGSRFLEQVRARWPETIRILLTGYADIASTIDAINKGQIFRYISKPWNDNDILLIVRHALERKELERAKAQLEALTLRQNEELKTLNASLEVKVQARTTELAGANEKLKSSFLTSIKVFANLIDLRENALAGHSRRVADLARKIANKLELSPRDVQDGPAGCVAGQSGDADVR
jgi:response regulator RpfG family c-di-GMP phosphodiesterase